MRCVRHRYLLGALVVLAAMAAGTMARGEGEDAEQIRHLMKATWETASTPLSVDPVVVRAGYAIAGWVQDQRGGRALLRKAHSKWEVVLCAGDHLRAADTLTAAGVPAGAAEQLVAGLHKAEAALPRETLLRFSSFDSVLRMDGGSHHHK